MPNRKFGEFRALPAAVFVPQDTTKMLSELVARVPENKRSECKFIIPICGRYRANTDQIVLYNHEIKSKLPGGSPKADLEEVTYYTVSDIPQEVLRFMMGCQREKKISNGEVVEFLRKYWNDSFEHDSPVTLLVCRNLRGTRVDYYIDEYEFHNSLGSKRKE